MNSELIATAKALADGLDAVTAPGPVSACLRELARSCELLEKERTTLQRAIVSLQKEVGQLKAEPKPEQHPDTARLDWLARNALAALDIFGRVKTERDKQDVRKDIDSAIAAQSDGLDEWLTAEAVHQAKLKAHGITTHPEQPPAAHNTRAGQEDAGDVSQSVAQLQKEIVGLQCELAGHEHSEGHLSALVDEERKTVAELLKTLKLCEGNVSSMNDTHPKIWGVWLSEIRKAIAMAEERVKQ